MEPDKKNYDRKVSEIKLLYVFHTSMDRLETIWKAFGINEEQCAERSDVVIQHVEILLKDLVKEENSSYETLVKRVSQYTKELKSFSLELDVEIEEPDKNMPLIKKEKELRKRIDALEHEKYARIEKYKQLLEKESSLCDSLAMPKSAQSKFSVPTKSELKELEGNIKMLLDEKERRYRKYCSAKQELSTIMEEAEFSPETSFEREVVCYEDDTFILSNENLQQITELLMKFQKRKLRLDKEIKCSTEKVKDLWERLDIEIEERTAFLEKCKECRQSTLSAIKHEIERCEEMRRQNMESYIVKLRKELADLWGKCFVSEKRKQSFTLLNSTDFTEELLDLYEKEVENLKNYHNQTQSILQKVEKWNHLWELMLKFEQKSADPSRYHNRGGNLLQEERERKRIIKELPKLEEEIEQCIIEYDSTHDEPFLLCEQEFKDYISEKWNHHMKERENEKLERQRQRMLLLNGKAPKTPSKRPQLSTPVSVPTKSFRKIIRPAGDCASAVRLRKPKPRTPLSYNKRKSVKRTPQQNGTTHQKVLIKKNETTPQQLHTDTTSYSQFVSELDNRGMGYYRSSVVVTRKKVLGSKISHDGILNKSVSRLNRSVRKSANFRSSMVEIELSD